MCEAGCEPHVCWYEPSVQWVLCHLSLFTVITEKIRFGRAERIWVWPCLSLRYASKFLFFSSRGGIMEFCWCSTIARYCSGLSQPEPAVFKSLLVRSKHQSLQAAIMWPDKEICRGWKQWWLWFNLNCQFASHEHRICFVLSPWRYFGA